VVEQRELAGPVPSGASVRVMQGFFEGLELPVDRDWMVVGRGHGADLLITEPTISRAHAAKRKPRTALNTGDEIQLGKLCLRVTLPSVR